MWKEQCAELFGPFAAKFPTQLVRPFFRPLPINPDDLLEAGIGDCYFRSTGDESVRIPFLRSMAFINGHHRGEPSEQHVDNAFFIRYFTKIRAMFDGHVLRPVVFAL